METVTSTLEQNITRDDAENDSTCISSKSNLPVVDELSTIGYARKNVRMYWTNACNIAKDHSFWLSKDVLYSAFLTRTSQNIVQVLLHPEQKVSQCACNRLVSLETATSVANCKLIKPYSPRDCSDEKTVPNELPLGQIMATSAFNGTIDGTLNVNIPNYDRSPMQIYTSHMRGSRPSVPSSVKIIDPSTLLLIQRRLKSVTALTANNMTEPICIHHATLLVRDGYKQLAKSMKKVKRLVGDLPPCAGLSAMKSETSVSNVVEVYNQGTTLVELPNNIGNASSKETLGEDFCFCEDSSSNDVDVQLSMGSSPEHFHSESNEEKLMYNEYECDINWFSPPPFIDQRKRTIPSPSNTFYTYRSDDSWENEPFTSYTSSDSANAMPFIFISPLTKNSTNNEEEIRSLLSQSILLSRRRAYMYRRSQRLVSYGKSILPRLVCRRY